MDDLINRQDVLALPRNKTRNIRGEIVEETIDVAYVEQLPSAQPMRKKGRWKRRLVDSGFNADWHCSECGWKTSLEEHGYNYCPNCGAKMEGEG